MVQLTIPHLFHTLVVGAHFAWRAGRWLLLSMWDLFVHVRIMLRKSRPAARLYRDQIHRSGWFNNYLKQRQLKWIRRETQSRSFFILSNLSRHDKNGWLYKISSPIPPSNPLTGLEDPVPSAAFNALIDPSKPGEIRVGMGHAGDVRDHFNSFYTKITLNKSLDIENHKWIKQKVLNWK